VEAIEEKEREIMNAPKKTLHHLAGVYIGMDPELFIRDAKGHIVPSEVVIPPGGMNFFQKGQKKKEVVRDGVQAEIHPRPYTCRANMANELSAILRGFIKEVRKKGYNLDFTQTIEIPKGQFAKLSAEAKALGCMPSFNVYDPALIIKVNPQTYRKRSAGGHIHLGIGKTYVPVEEYPRVVKLLDTLVGNTCVMIDRDPLAAIRRRNYGRAGEFRTPPHGLEYRTLSNFWLRAYPLMSFVTGMCRFAIDVEYNSRKNPAGIFQWEFADTLLGMVDEKAIRKAIDKNDVDLAKKNWKKVRAFIEEFAPNSLESGLYAGSLDAFDYFIEKIDEGGLDYWFPVDKTEERWLNQGEGHGCGWESFLANKVDFARKHEKVHTPIRNKVKEIEARINAKLNGDK
jgi:hypothetical protein